MLPPLLAVALVAAGARTFVVDATQSRIVVQVGRAGVLSFAGHEHRVGATRIEGRIVADPADLAASSVEIQVDAAGLQVDPRNEGDDAPKVQARMDGPDVLDVV